MHISTRLLILEMDANSHPFSIPAEVTSDYESQGR